MGGVGLKDKLRFAQKNPSHGEMRREWKCPVVIWSCVVVSEIRKKIGDVNVAVNGVAADGVGEIDVEYLVSLVVDARFAMGLHLAYIMSRRLIRIAQLRSVGCQIEPSCVCFCKAVRLHVCVSAL